MNESEKRQRKRVSVELPLQFYTLETDDKKRPITSGKGEKLWELDEILSSLDSMVSEINRIKRTLQGVIAVSEDNSSGHISDLSAKGLRFFSDRVLKKGDMIQLRLVLPLQEKTIIDIEAKVIWVQRAENDKGCNEIAVEFEGLSEKDESHIIKYTFVREREEALSNKA